MISQQELVKYTFYKMVPIKMEPWFHQERHRLVTMDFKRLLIITRSKKRIPTLPPVLLLLAATLAEKQAVEPKMLQQLHQRSCTNAQMAIILSLELMAAIIGSIAKLVSCL